jgi:hypothetical protein
MQMSRPMKRPPPIATFLALLVLAVIPRVISAADEPLPFTHKVEVYRDKEGDISAFSLRLAQPFLADEFERNNYLRLSPLDQNAYLIYPKEARFVQKHAEFYGRLRGMGAARVRLAYEVVSENPDGSRRVDTRQGDLEISIPAEPGGPVEIYKTWAREQNSYIHDLLKIYPHETFFQYVLLQSAQRHGVAPPALPGPAANPADNEVPLYQVITGSLAVQEALQATTLRGSTRAGDLNVHISQLARPRLRSLPYAELLEEKIRRDGKETAVPAIAGLVPIDRYFLHFNTIASAGDLLDLTEDWGNNLLRLATVQARDHDLQAKLEEQLAVERGPLTSLFADQVLSEMAVVGADPFVLEGSDVSLVFKVRRRELFEKSLEMWLEKARQKHPELTVREFNYRGHKVHARYTLDRLVSSFVAWHEDHVIVSNSHRAVRDILDAATGSAPRLSDALDFRYVVSLLPPSAEENAAYLYVSEACLRRLVGPEAKISEKRRMECFSNLVMLNNASLFYRLENGRSPDSLTDLAAGRFADTSKIVCPHGGAYAWDAKHDACTCSLHNRLRYLTPNLELSVLTTSDAERREYERYRERYEKFWGTLFDPIAVRIFVGPTVKLETCVLPTAPGSIYHSLRGTLDAKPRPLDTSRVARSAVVSTLAVPGRKRLADFLRKLPGTAEALAADPTLTELSWLGDRLELHYCDASTIVEVDPSRLRKLQVPLVGEAPLPLQSMVAAAVWSIQVPMYLAIDVEDKEKAARLLEKLAGRLFLEKNQALGFPITLDSYRLPDYKEHPVYVFSYQFYAVKVRLHAALVGEQLVVATRPHVLEEVIDAAAAPRESSPPEGHLLLRLNGRSLVKMYDDLDLYWSERSRLACNRNTISIYNLVKLYDVSVEKAGELSQSKYGVRHFCPDGGHYHYEADRDQVLCSVHGNRRHSRQRPELGGRSSFAQLLSKIDRVTALLRFDDEALMATVEISRRQAKE